MTEQTHDNMTKTSITDKDWLDLAWKHFQQHAQQRIQYFNYFVIFSTILSTGLVSTFQNNFQAPYLGIGIGLIQAYLAFIFWKIDERNRLLTKHGENIIKEIEANYETTGNNSYKLFTSEVNETNKQKESNKNKFFLWHHFSHGKSYRIIFVTFFLIGIVGTTISFLNFMHPIPPVNDNKKIEGTIQIRIDRIDSLNNLILIQETKLNLTHNEIKNVNLKIDSIQKTILKLSKKSHNND
jgi:hypothetical protein